MDGTTGMPDAAGSHIWLRYATQFPVGERIHTIEIGIPVPLGASEETRERLLREADAGMNQLANHVESRVAQIQQTLLHSGGVASAKTAPVPVNINKAAAPPTTAPAPVNINKITPQPTSASAPANRVTPSQAPALPTIALPKTPTAPSPREAPSTDLSEGKEVTMPSTRPSIGASMPSTPGVSSHGSDSLKLPEFIQFIKDRLGLTPKQAMEKLNVKTLSGLNYRDAIEQLQQVVSKEETNSDVTEQKPREGTPTRPDLKRSAARDDDTVADAPTIPIASALSPLPPSSIASSSSASTKAPDIIELRNAVVREVPPALAFDEEVDLEDLDKGEEEEELALSPDLTEADRGLAEDVLSRLREARGSSAASPGRLKVLHNIVDSQISAEQLQQLIEGIWNVVALNKLKNDQLEALISWAKEDDFVGEVEMVLALLQEEEYARSDR